jgi:hypothetical protein
MKKGYVDSPLAVVDKHDSEKDAATYRQHGWRDGMHPPRVQSRSAVPLHADNPNPDVHSWKHVTACEARNVLQVILSGAEILLDHQSQALTADQQMLLRIMSENALHLANLIVALTKIDEASARQDAAKLHSLQAMLAKTEFEEL